MKTDTCRACSAPLIWCVTDRGARAPMNATPDPTVAAGFALREDGAHVVATWVRREHVGDRPLHTSHFADCPAAKSFRRTR